MSVQKGAIDLSEFFELLHGTIAAVVRSSSTTRQEKALAEVYDLIHRYEEYAALVADDMPDEDQSIGEASIQDVDDKPVDVSDQQN